MRGQGVIEIGLSTGFIRPASVEYIVEICREAGISDLELWDHDGFFADAGDAAAVRSVLDGAGLRVRSLHGPFTPGAVLPRADRERYTGRFQSSCTKGKIYGARYVVLHPVVVEGESASAEDIPRSAPESLRLWRELAAAAAAEGLDTAFENIPAGRGWPGGCTWQTTLRIAEAVGAANAGTCLDLSHAFAVGDNARIPAALESGTLPLGIHISDGIDGGAADLHLPPGEGDMDWKGLFGVLGKRRFSGRLVIEANSSNLDARLVGSIYRFLRAFIKNEEVA